MKKRPGADIERAGRHEERLNSERAEELKEVGEQTQEIAGDQAEAAN